MKQFEYKIKEIGGDMHDLSYLPGETEENQLNEEGKLGWELISVMDTFAFFKREKQKEEKYTVGMLYNAIRLRQI